MDEEKSRPKEGDRKDIGALPFLLLFRDRKSRNERKRAENGYDQILSPRARRGRWFDHGAGEKCGNEDADEAPGTQKVQLEQDVFKHAFLRSTGELSIYRP